MSAIGDHEGSVYRTSESVEETKVLGARLARGLPEGTLVALIGELGAGKTALVQGAADGLGARVSRGDDDEEGALSPTFVLIREYACTDGARIAHVDAHRLRCASELIDIGGDDVFGAARITFVEWADRVEAALPRPYLCVRMTHTGARQRRLELSGVGERSEGLVAAATRALATNGRGADTR